jgi:DNA-binding LacI/PurR family transcriptional regulator
MVAQRAGVSVSTVSRVLNKSPFVASKTVKRVHEAIDDLQYSPSSLARGLRVSETKTIGVIVSNIMNSFFTSMVRGVEDGANEANYSVILCNTDEKASKETTYLKTLVNKQVDGIILAGTGDIHNLQKPLGSVPLVLVDREISAENKIDTVLVDNVGGSYKAVRHLIEQGYRRIGIIAGSNVTTTGYGRLSGYKKALEKVGVPIDEDLIKMGDFLGDTSYKLAVDLLSHTDCDAIFAANNVILMAALRAAKDLGRQIPNDLGLIGFDDVDWMQLGNPQISAIRQPTYEIGKQAIQMLLRRIGGSVEEPEKEILDVDLIVRESTSRNDSVKRS